MVLQFLHYLQYSIIFLSNILTITRLHCFFKLSNCCSLREVSEAAGVLTAVSVVLAGTAGLAVVVLPAVAVAVVAAVVGAGAIGVDESIPKNKLLLIIFSTNLSSSSCIYKSPIIY